MAIQRKLLAKFTYIIRDRLKLRLTLSVGKSVVNKLSYLSHLSYPHSTGRQRWSSKPDTAAHGWRLWVKRHSVLVNGNSYLIKDLLPYLTRNADWAKVNEQKVRIRPTRDDRKSLFGEPFR